MELEKFSAQADKKLLKEIKTLANKEGSKFYALINEAFESLLEKRKQTKPRKSVIDQFEASLNEYDYLYDKLAK
jgi:ribonuclease HIII